MRRFIITGAPGAGKTAIIRQLELDGFSVVEEAATDVIAAAQAQGTAEPWTSPSFIDAITNLQRTVRFERLISPIRIYQKDYEESLPEKTYSRSTRYQRNKGRTILQAIQGTKSELADQRLKEAGF